ncbi:MAG: ribokinase, partial [Halanaerobiales bacterium]
IIGNNFSRKPGGKGANQALAAGRLGGNVNFIGSCGNDMFGDELISNLKNNNVNTEGVVRVDNNTGIASITVEKGGNNKIIIVEGANNDLKPTNIVDLDGKIESSDIIMLQFEIPELSIEYIINKANDLNKKIILDPAPVKKIPTYLYNKIDFLLPNEGELDQLIDIHNASLNEKAAKLLELGIGAVLLTKGKDGIVYFDNEGVKEFPAYNVQAVDTTGAGDAFAGAFAYALTKKISISSAIKFASAVAAYSVTKLGAQDSFPSQIELKKFLKNNENEGLILDKII